MENIDKTDFIEVYVLKTLNEIKRSVKWEINLDKERENEADKKMSLVLKDLINANFKNLQRDPQGNLIYTLLPIVDKRENEKVRLSLVLYYAALYYDNVDLLHDLLKENIDFVINSTTRLEYLDKSISSKFEREDYVKYIKEHGSMFWSFARSIKELNEEDREKYISRFASLFNANYEHICEYLKNEKRYCNLSSLFDKTNLDNLDDESYRLANDKQLEFIDNLGIRVLDADARKRLNNLIQTTDFANHLSDIGLMMKIYNDEELKTLNRDVSYFLSYYSQTDEMLQKAIEFASLRPDLTNHGVCIHRNTFMKISNPVLIEALAYMKKHYILINEHNLDAVSKTMMPKAGVKRVFGFYKKRDS